MDKDALEDLFAPWADIAIKRMFGGLGVFRDGLMFALVARGTLYFKTDDTTQAAFEAEGGRVFMYEAKGREISLGYATPPDAIFDDEDTLKDWADKAFGAARAKAQLKRPRARRG